MVEEIDQNIHPLWNNASDGRGVLVESTPSPLPLHIPAHGDLIRETLETQLKEVSTISLVHKPATIESVKLNNASITIGYNDDPQAEVLYDYRKQALLFRKAVSGLLQITYTRAPEIEPYVLHGAVIDIHKRISDLEQVVQKLRDRGII